MLNGMNFFRSNKSLRVPRDDVFSSAIAVDVISPACQSWTLELKFSAIMRKTPSYVVLMLAVVAVAGCCSGPKQSQRKDTSQTQVRRHPNLIAHIEHDNLSFSVSLDGSDTSFLNIHISEEDSVYKSSPLPTVQLRVQMTDDAVIEGGAQKEYPWVGNGGWMEMYYQFPLGRRALVDDIHSVTVSISGQKYVLSPF
jgi:hypothetical protein